MKKFPIELLACPDCKLPLAAVDSAPGFLSCARCGARFSLNDNPPRFYPLSKAGAIEAGLAEFKNRPGNARGMRFLRALIPPNSICDPDCQKRARRICERIKKGVILNLGAKSAGWGAHVLNLDIAQPVSGGVDMLCDIAALPFPDASIDGVVCTYVLEHVADARACLAEIARVLKPGGCVYIAVPFLFPFHPDPLDRWRWTLDGLRADMCGFDELEAGCSGGPFSALAALTPAACASIFTNFYLFNAVRFALGWMLWPLKFLDWLCAGSTRAASACANVFFFGVRRKD